MESRYLSKVDAESHRAFSATHSNCIHSEYVSQQVVVRILAMLENHCGVVMIGSGANIARGQHPPEVLPALFVIFRQFSPIDVITLSCFLI